MKADLATLSSPLTFPGFSLPSFLDPPTLHVTILGEAGTGALGQLVLAVPARLLCVGRL